MKPLVSSVIPVYYGSDIFQGIFRKYIKSDSVL